MSFHRLQSAQLRHFYIIDISGCFELHTRYKTHARVHKRGADPGVEPVVGGGLRGRKEVCLSK